MSWADVMMMHWTVGIAGCKPIVLLTNLVLRGSAVQKQSLLSHGSLMLF
jgi:hypothetical protein